MKKQNTIEELLKKLDGHRVPMTIDETDMLIQMILAEEAGQETVDAMYEEMKKKSWVLQALEKRLKVCLTISITKPILIMILFLNKGNIGQSIIYLYYLQYIAKKLGINKIDNAVFCDKIFPLGLLNRDKMHEFWIAQKSKVTGEDNMLDIAEYSESIMH